MGLSFETIAGFGANGAIIHYKPEPATAARIDKNNVFLLDSGAQYRYVGGKCEYSMQHLQD